MVSMAAFNTALSAKSVHVPCPPQMKIASAAVEKSMDASLVEWLSIPMASASCFRRRRHKLNEIRMILVHDNKPEEDLGHQNTWWSTHHKLLGRLSEESLP